MNSSDEQASGRCSQCGAILTRTLAEELCPQCLLKRALELSPSEVAARATEMDATQTVDPDSQARPSVSAGNGLTRDRVRQSDLQAGQLFGDYTIVRRLGRGGMGIVYEADHRPTGRRLALKVLSRALDDPQARTRFLREGRLAASINHPNSVYVYGTEEINDTPTISMELIRGGTLQQWIKAKGEMDVTEAVDAVLQIIDGLEAADHKGVLHRDVKPANCFIDPSGTIKIGDFGLSISTGPRDDPAISQVTREGTVLGTPAFASPEQLRGDPLDRRSDIYSVGVTLYYLLTGQAPFTGENMVQLLATVLDKPAPSVRLLRDDIPEELETVIARCLQKSPGQRFAGYDSLREALLPHSSMKSTPAPLGSRLIANIIDMVLVTSVVTSINYLWQWMMYGYIVFIPRFEAAHAWYNVVLTVSMLMLVFLYYAVSEWRYGKTIGKHLLGLRVVDLDQKINWRQACLRSAVFVFLPNLPSLCYSVAIREMSFEKMQEGITPWIGMGVGISYYLFKLGIFAPARKRNGYAGIHELVSGTRVVCPPKLEAAPQQNEPAETFDPDLQSQRIGPYYVLKDLWGEGSNRLVLAFDAKLLRRVWVRVQPVGHLETSPVERNLSRATRLRWLGGRRSDTECWDCYEAPTGKPLASSIREGLRWEAVITALGQLAKELPLASQEESLPPHLSLANLWITDEQSLKILPFSQFDAATRENRIADVDQGTGGTADPMPALRETVAVWCEAIDGGTIDHTMPLSVRDSLDDLRDASSLEEASALLATISAQPAVNVARRVTGMLAVSLAVPTLLILSSLAGILAMEQQKARMPRVTELSKAAIQWDIERGLRPGVPPANRPDRQQRIEAIETWIAGGYRDVWEDRAQMGSFYALMSIPPHRREQLKNLMEAPPPSQEQTRAAEKVYREIQAEDAKVVPAEIAFFSFPGLMFLATVSWMELIWIPSLLTAIIFRGGALLWIFGLTLVNRRGKRASRLRVSIRMLIGGVPAVAICYTFLMSDVFGGPIRGGWQVAMFLIVVLIAIVAMLTHIRLPHDRLAGTYLVAR